MVATEEKSIISITNVNKYYGDKHVLKNINLEIKNGEVLVILGPSGSGKSTLLKTINGLESIQSGEVLINSQVYNSKNKVELPGKKRSEVGMVFQHFNLYPHLTVFENVILALRKVKKKSKADAKMIALPILKKVGLEDKIDCYPAQLSGGEQQRVAIARSLAMKPKVMLFDEPTSALDVELVNEVLDTMMQLSMEGMTMVVVTHELNFARRVATKVAFIDKGEIIEQGKPHDIIIHPQMDRTRNFMNKIFNERSVLHSVKKRGVINIGVVDSAPPMCFSDDNDNLVGFDIDLAKLLAERLNVSLNLKKITKEERLQYLLSNKIDACIAKLNHTKSRDNIIDYSVSYLQNCKKLLMYKDNIGDVNNLNGKNIAYVVGTSTATQLESCMENACLGMPNFIAYVSDWQAYDAMKKRIVDGYASDEIIMNYFLNSDKDNDGIIFHPNVCCYSYFGIGVTENDSEWLNEINNDLIDIYKSGDYDKLFNKWFKDSDKKFFRPLEKWSVS